MNFLHYMHVLRGFIFGHLYAICSIIVVMIRKISKESFIVATTLKSSRARIVQTRRYLIASIKEARPVVLSSLYIRCNKLSVTISFTWQNASAILWPSKQVRLWGQHISNQIKLRTCNAILSVLIRNLQIQILWWRNN